MTTAFIEFGVAELTYVGETNTSTTGGTVAPHGSAQAGDIAVLMAYGTAGSPAANTPSGWTPIVFTQYGGLGAAMGNCLLKKLAAGDLVTGVTGISGASVQRQIMLVFHPDDDVDTITVSTPSGFADASDPPDQTVSASGQAAPLVVIGFNGCTTVASDDMNSSPAFDLIVETVNAARAGYKIYNSAPADHTVSATGAGASVLQSFYIRVE